MQYATGYHQPPGDDRVSFGATPQLKWVRATPRHKVLGKILASPSVGSAEIRALFGK